tara:strand:- start:4572 stop:5378 length:807 start_codon:yes stop_codon:yes gene_type:complete
MISFIEEIKDDPRFIDRGGFSMHDELHQKFWVVEDKLKPEIRDRLIEIVKDFMDGVGEDIKIDDITFTGSLANFNWSSYSDIDLHILVDFKTVDENTDLVRDFFNSKKSQWNRAHDIHILGFEVEVYIQDTNEPHISTGVYSLMQDEWLTKPTKEAVDIDWPDVEKKAVSLMDQIDRLSTLHGDAEYKEAYGYASKLKDKIKKFRQSGLDRAGQYSSENIAFKALRRNEYIGKLMSLRTASYDKMMSMSDSPSVKVNVSEVWKEFLDR